MSRSLLRLLVGILVTAMLTACAPGKTPQPVIEASPSPTVEPTAIPIHSSGPAMGNTMVWMDGNTLIYIPAGEFRMGGNVEDNPEHIVNLSAFWIYSTKVTNRQYAECVEAGQCTLPQDATSSTNLNEHFSAYRPVAGIDWKQAAAYCQWVGGSLPTEAQWEKAARGPNGNIHPWGDSEPTCDLLNFNNCIGRVTNSNAYPSGISYYGAMDMEGNVQEWVSDWYDPSYPSVAFAQDPLGPAQGQERAIRGSHFSSPPADVASVHRSQRKPDEYAANLGFRCVISRPEFTAPFCQFTASDVSGTVSSPRDSCQIIVDQISEDCQVGNLVVRGVTQEIANPTPPLSCTPLEKNPGFRCFAPRPNKSGIVEVCGTCTESESAYNSGLNLGCYPGYTFTSSNICEYNLPSPSSQDGCPTDSILLAEGQCAFSPSADNLCLPGTYFDTSAQMCIGTPAEQSCLPGHMFDKENQCCNAARALGFPCSTGEFLAEYFGCLPLPRHQAVTSCTTVQVTLEFCMCYTFSDAGSCTAAGCKWIWNYKNPPNFGRCDAPD